MRKYATRKDNEAIIPANFPHIFVPWKTIRPHWTISPFLRGYFGTKKPTPSIPTRWSRFQRFRVIDPDHVLMEPAEIPHGTCPFFKAMKGMHLMNPGDLISGNFHQPDLGTSESMTQWQDWPLHILAILSAKKFLAHTPG